MAKKNTKASIEADNFSMGLEKAMLKEYCLQKLAPAQRAGRFGARYEVPIKGPQLNYAMADVFEMLNNFKQRHGGIDHSAKSAERLAESVKNYVDDDNS